MQTQEEIRREGLEALRERLGQGGMLRFLAQFERGEGDYAVDRHRWADDFSIQNLRNELLFRQNEAKDITPNAPNEA
ncbi:hypothetical protein [Stratiformator vulcanicus]|uniref:Uncharacterized protein n=1 Tax=Stratiformator vulcanicus TaxID=2527980 RepID=A0A517R4C0_9PLAN|nr:hypothetical protein [Stratiformator vulcanicus]QDT38734.1 hypothetical protein Pan189_31310 [Stratiformator vulcanicus]